MLIELSDDAAMKIRVALALTAYRNEKDARRYDDDYDRPKLRKMFRKRADDSFKLLNDFRVASGFEAVTLSYVMGEDDE